LAVVFAGASLAFSGLAQACLCPNYDAAALEANSAKFEQVFAGLIISTERIHNRQFEGAEVDSGSSIKSKVLVLRVWRGTPPTVAEVWTPVIDYCGIQPFPGLYFVALAKREAGRSVAEYNECNCALRAYTTQGPATFAIGGIAALGAVLGLVVAAAVWLWRIVRRKRRSTASV